MNDQKAGTASTYRVPYRNQLARFILRPTFRLIFHILARIRIVGRENVPASGPYLIAMNHVSIYDPPFIVAFWPTCPEAAGAIEIWSKPGQATLARLYYGIPVRRGEYDRRLIETMLQALQSGRPLLIAPEGGRSHTPGLQPGFPGVAYLMDIARVPVVPVGIVGTTDDFFQCAIRGQRPLLEIKIGKPFLLPEIAGSGEARRAARRHNVDLIMYSLAELLPPGYKGVYANTIDESAWSDPHDRRANRE